jgi:hypothetical protein
MSAKLYPWDGSEEDRRFIRSWKVGVAIAYTVVALGLVGYAVATPSIRNAAEVQIAAEK